MKNNILKLSYLMLGLFLVLLGYLTYLQIWKGPALASNPYNHRFLEQEARKKEQAQHDSGQERGPVDSPAAHDG